MRLVNVLFFISSICYFTSSLQAQNIGINTALPDASSILDITHTNRGLLIPRIVLTDVTVAAPITTPALSLLVFNTNTTVGANGVKPGYYYWNGTQWVGIGTGNAWELLGNTGTNAATNFIGTTDAQDLVFKTNGVENMRVLNSNGNAGIGTVAPSSPLHVFGNGINQVARMESNTAFTYMTFKANGDLSHNGIANAGADNMVILTNGIERTRFTSNGNVGIGTTTPIFKLDIFESLGGANTAAARFMTNTTNAGIMFQDLNTTIRPAIFSRTNDLSIWTGNQAQLWITGAGNVGIGTGFSTPTEKLEVQGSVKIVDGTQGPGKVLTSDAFGKATWQNQIGSWYAHLSDGSSVNAPGSQAPIDFTNSALVGVGGSVNTTTDQIVVPVTGLYRVLISGWGSGLTTPYLIMWNIYRNGTVVWNPHYSGAQLGWGTNLSSVTVYNLTAGDVLTVKRECSISGYEGITGSVLFSVELIK